MIVCRRADPVSGALTRLAQPTATVSKRVYRIPGPRRLRGEPHAVSLGVAPARGPAPTSGRPAPPGSAGRGLSALLSAADRAAAPASARLPVPARRGGRPGAIGLGSFLRGLDEDRLNLEGRGSLWPLLARIAICKYHDLVEAAH